MRELRTSESTDRQGRAGILWSSDAILAAVVLVALGSASAIAPTASETVAQEKGARIPADARDDLELFADPIAVLRGNEFACELGNAGDICEERINNVFGQGGFWPRGAPNPYIFGSGIQLAGIVGPNGGPWAGDTAGAYFFDLRGTQSSGTPLTDIYDSAEPEDLEKWPPEARIRDENLFRPADVGRAALSEQDTWVQYWEGDPGRTSGRDHPMGVRITQRSLQWNYPSGNESVIYFLLDLENVSDEETFRRLSEAQFFGEEEVLPEDGYSLTELYVNSTADMDVTTDAGENFSTAILPFDLSISYHGRFDAPAFAYSPQLFYPPFFTRAPGIVGIKLLATPGRVTGGEPGATMWTSFTGSSVGFPPPRGADQLWRYMAGKLDVSEADLPCSLPAQIEGATPAATERSVCHVDDTARDTRFMMASGPFELEPNESRTLALAYVIAPTLATLPDGTPTGIVANTADAGANPPGIPSFHPGFASARGCTDDTATDCTDVDPVNDVRPVERGAGWVAYDGPPPGTPLESPSQKLDQFAVETATHSLLDRALVAQTIFDAKFLRPMPPEAPVFHLLPGDGAVTVLWEPSATDEEGDPFHQLASDTASVLFNPNYREFDVVGYELWRGTSASELEVLAVYVEDEPYVDRICETVRPSVDLGLEAGPGYSIGEECPEGFEQELDPFTIFFGRQPVFNNGRAGGRPGRGVVRAASGSATFVSELRPFPLPEWDGAFPRAGPVPYVHRDTTPVNNFTYFYAVTAIDLNSPASGPPTQRSPRSTRSVVPRSEAPNRAAAQFEIVVEDGNGDPLPSGRPYPTIDYEDGTFDGPFPPTRTIEMSFAPLVPQLLPDLDLGVRIDSVKPDWEQQEGCTAGPISFQSTCWRMFLTTGGQSMEIAGLASNWSAFQRPALGVTRTESRIASIPYDEEALNAFGIESLEATADAAFRLDESINFSNWEGQQNRRQIRPNTLHGGPRWFSGTEETTPDPTRFIRVGHLSEIDSVWVPIHHTPVGPGLAELPNSASVQWFGYGLAHLGRSADFKVTWRDGTISVRDVTHEVDVPFSGDYGSSWGFLNDDCDGSDAVDWVDFYCVGGGRSFWQSNAFGGTSVTLSPASLAARPDIGPIALDTNLPQGPTHQGFALYLNGMRHFFVTDRIPSDGTVWTLRAYHGAVRALDRFDTENPGEYLYFERYDPFIGTDVGGNGVGSPLIPGLTLRWRASPASLRATASADLAAIHTVPDPYFFASAYDGGGLDKELVFVNLPPRATLRIYTLGGVLVDVVDHDDPTGGGRAPWDLRNRSDRLVASGVYFWHVVTPGGEERVGKFTIINPHRD